MSFDFKSIIDLLGGKDAYNSRVRGGNITILLRLICPSVAASLGHDAIVLLENDARYQETLLEAGDIGNFESVIQCKYNTLSAYRDHLYTVPIDVSGALYSRNIEQDLYSKGQGKS